MVNFLKDCVVAAAAHCAEVSLQSSVGLQWIAQFVALHFYFVSQYGPTLD